MQYLCYLTGYREIKLALIYLSNSVPFCLLFVIPLLFPHTSPLSSLLLSNKGIEYPPENLTNKNHNNFAIGQGKAYFANFMLFLKVHKMHFKMLFDVTFHPALLCGWWQKGIKKLPLDDLTVRSLIWLEAWWQIM